MRSTSTATSDLELAETGETARQRYLLDRPQRLGILPTWWFWRNKQNWRVARLPVMVVMEAVLLAVLLTELSLPYWAIGLIPPAVLAISLGLFERYIRRRAQKRRSLAEASE